MSEVLVIASPADERRVRTVVEALHHHGVDLWWERGLAGSEAVRRKASESRCVLLLLDAHLLQDDGLAALAQRAATARRLIIGRLDRTPLPEWLAGTTTIDLSSFKRNKNDLFFLDLVAAAKAKVAGIDPPPARGPLNRLLRRLALATPAALVALGIVANLLGLISIKDIAYDVLRRPSAVERSDFEKIALGRAGSCEQLKAFNTAHGRDGYYYDEAMALIENARTETRTVFTPMSAAGLPATQDAMSQTPSPDPSSAMSKAVEGAKRQAETTCRETFAAPDGRFVGVTLTGAPVTQCYRLADGHRCKGQVTFTCNYEVPQEVKTAICGRS